jgi:hypothetical protein
VAKWTEAMVKEYEGRMERLRAQAAKDAQPKLTVRTHYMDGKPPPKNAKQGGRRSKYGAVKTEADGKKFDSRREAKRWMELRVLENAKKILDLKHHVMFDCMVNGMLVCRYEADFVYLDGVQLVVEDAKGYRTREYILKRKLMRACNGIEIKEV